MRKWFFFIVAAALLVGTDMGRAQDSPLPEIPVKGTVTMLNIGLDICISCQRMSTIIGELKRDYQGKAAIIYLDISKHEGLGEKYKVRAVPTQIFYDKNGKEHYKHDGYLSKKRCVEYLEKLSKGQ